MELRALPGHRKDFQVSVKIALLLTTGCSMKLLDIFSSSFFRLVCERMDRTQNIDSEDKHACAIGVK